MMMLCRSSVYCQICIRLLGGCFWWIMIIAIRLFQAPSEHRLRAVICGTATSESLRRETSSGRRFDLSLSLPLPLCRRSPPSRPSLPWQAQGCVLGEKRKPRPRVNCDRIAGSSPVKDENSDTSRLPTVG